MVYKDWVLLAQDQYGHGAAVATGEPDGAAMSEAHLHEVARLLDVLSTTYPAWDIRVEPHESGDSWIAELRQPLTQQLRNAGLVKVLRDTAGVALGSALSRQANLLHRVGPSTFT